MKRIILWGLLVFSMFALNVSAKEEYIVKVEILNSKENLKTNLAFYSKSDISAKYQIFENGFYLLKPAESEVFSTQTVLTYVIPEEFIDTQFRFVINDSDGRYKTDAFSCHFIKDADNNNVCYNEYDYEAGLIKNLTNLNIVYNALMLFKDSWMAIVGITLILISLAIIYNKVMHSKGVEKSLANNDIFYIIFNVAIIILSYALYIINFFNSYSELVLVSIVLAVYYFIYYLSKFLESKKVGGWTFLYAMIAYFIALGSSVLMLSYFI